MKLFRVDRKETDGLLNSGAVSVLFQVYPGKTR